MADAAEDNVPIAFAVTIAAGLSTTIGAALAFCARKQSMVFLTISMAASAGVMLYVSFIEILLKSIDSFTEVYPDSEGQAWGAATGFFFLGIVLSMALHSLVHWLGGHTHLETSDFDSHDPDASLDASTHDYGDEDADGAKPAMAAPVSPTSSASDHDAGSDDAWSASSTYRSGTSRRTARSNTTAAASGPSSSSESDDNSHGDDDDASARRALAQKEQHAKKLKHTSFVTAAAISLHNLPEGLATFVATVDDPRLGAALAIGIGLHNIPEGTAVAMPVYYATHSRVKAFGLGLLSGLSEPLGGLLGYGVLQWGDFSPWAFGVLFGLVGGVMVYISVQELIPTALRFDTHDRFTSKSVFVGMAIMALSIVLLRL